MSGNFFLQVIINALALYDLDVIAYNSSDSHAVAARQNSFRQQAFICNRYDHWFTLRKIGSKWYDLNSLLKDAEEIEDEGTHISCFATEQQINEFAGIFIVSGSIENTGIFEKEYSPIGLLNTQSCTEPMDVDEPSNSDMECESVFSESHMDTTIEETNKRKRKKRKSTIVRKTKTAKRCEEYRS